MFNKLIHRIANATADQHVKRITINEHENQDIHHRRHNR